MLSSPPRKRSSARSLLLTIFLIGSLVLSLTPLGGLSPAFFMPTAHAASFAPGNLVVYRVGDGSTALSGTAAPVFLDEYTPSGTLVQTIALPTATAGTNRKLTASGSATSEGLMTRSADGKYLVLAGYDAAVGTLSVATSSTSTVNRVIGRVDVGGNIDTTTALADSSGNPRSAVSTNGTDLWLTGNNNGLRYTTLGGTTSIQVSSTPTNLRHVNIFGGQLYVSAQSGTTRLATVGSGTPTTAGQTITNLPGFPTSTGSPYGFFFADLSAGVPGVDTVYVADDTSNATGLLKYSLVGASWVSNGNVSGATLRGLTGVVSGTSVTLYATSGAALVKFTDNSGHNAAISGSLTTIASAGANRAFRGVALAPVAGQVSTNPSGTGSASPSTVKAGDSTLLSVGVTPGTNPTSLSYTVKGDLTAIGGSPEQEFFGSGTGPYVFNATIAANTTPGTKNIPITITDDQARTGPATITIIVQPESLSHVVISQVYGGGGNSGATLTHDFIELYNPTASPVSLDGWSVQYASASGGTWQVTDLAGTIAPGQYYLVREAQGAGGTTPLPTPNAVGSIPMSATNGKVALVDNQDSLTAACDNDPDIVDFVGYGTANCFEGSGAAGGLSNTTAALRNDNGNVDTDNNNADFTIGAPNPRNSAGGGGGGGSEVAPFVSNTSPSNNAANVFVDSNITVNFSEPVLASGTWYSINCATSLTHTATVSGGPTSFTLNPTVNFANGEQCTVTITASQITDLDGNDPPDQMLANYTWTFTTISASGIIRNPDEHLVMGNPSGATSNVADENNYLMKKPEYALSYNRSRAIPNWTSWHLDSSWRGSQSRTNTFRADTTLPDGWYQVNEFSYSGSGFDRGHMTPSADRTFNFEENAATFLMTNMIPQAPDNNQGPWEQLESYARQLLTEGNEVYIISGGYGQGGTGRNGFMTTVDQGRVVVPAQTWKVLLVLPNADGDDLARVNNSTRTIAVIMPNAQGLNQDWKSFIVSVDEVEALTDYNFFSNVPEDIQSVIEANADGNTRPAANSQTVMTNEDTALGITLTATDAENNPLTFNVTGGPSHGTLSGSGSSLTYTPAPNYNGPDSFTFTASDKYLTSETATVTINVAAGNDPPVADAGPDQMLECTGSTAVTLNGSDSSDLDGDTLAYEWREGANLLGTGALLNTQLASGSHTITLRVTDPSGDFDEDTVNVQIVDTIAPVLISSTQAISIWPANKKYHMFNVSGLVESASDSCDSGVNLSSVVITKVTSDEGNASSNDILIAADCRSVQLRADRDGNGDGRVYTITFRVADAAGNTQTLTRQVIVPHDQGNGDVAIDSGTAYMVTSSCQ
jgi:DNA/RNA endonuclease G (NUC1)